MSSPIANSNRTHGQKLLVKFHQLYVHSNRINKLSEAIGTCINDLFSHRQSPVSALDVGCGDMTIAETISAVNPNIHWTCADIHELPPAFKDSEKWNKYRCFDGEHLPFGNDSFDVVLFCDVLHHCPPKTQALLREAARVGRYVVIKDHFEEGWYSRTMLRLMDFIGNYGYGIEIPDRYFTKNRLQKIIQSVGLKEHGFHKNIDLYPDHWFANLFLKSSWQFIGVFERA